MKLNVKNIRYLTPDDWRTLTATEQGSRNHEVVPTPLIAQLASLRSGNGAHKCISTLAKIGLIAKVKNAKYDGYRLTYGGLDYLALHTHTKTSVIYSVGNQIGIGKESDIFVCASETGKQLVLKLHRLGRISFRTVKANRDYLRNRNSGSWMYMSRLAAIKEYEFMKALKREGFPVPEPVGQSRHTVVMELINAFPMRQISKVGDAAPLYSELLSLIVRLAQHGLIHGDFNEFNVLVEEREESDDTISLIPTLIDFPQMVSIDHANAEYYFDRDVACIKRFFQRRFGFTSDEDGPHFKEATKTITKRLDVEVQASGFSIKMAKELETYMKEHGIDGDAGDAGEVDMDEGEDGDVEGVEDDMEIDMEPDTQDAALPVQPTPSTLASEMTILDIPDDDNMDSASAPRPHETDTDEDLSDEQIRELLNDAADRMRAKAAGQPVPTPNVPFRLPKLNPGHIADTHERTDGNITRLDHSKLIDKEQQALANGMKKIEDPLLAKRQKEEEKKAHAGSDWYNMPKTDLTPELRRDLQLLKMRNVLDPKRHYKKDNARNDVPAFSQVGTIIEGPTEFYSSRITNKDRKQTLLEEVAAQEKESGRFQQKYEEINKGKASGKKAHYKALQAKKQKAGWAI